MFLVYLQDKLDAYAATLESAFKDSSSEVPIVMGQTYIAYDDELYHRVRALSQEGRKVMNLSKISYSSLFPIFLVLCCCKLLSVLHLPKDVFTTNYLM